MLARLLLVGVAAACVLSACQDDADTADDTTPSSMSSPTGANHVAATELVTGDCISGLVIGAAERTLVDSVRVVDCGSVHDLEVFATFDLSPEDFEDTEPGIYPGEQRVVRQADQGCAGRLDELGVDDEFGLIAVWPSDTSWMQGDRGVTCAAFPRDGEPFEGRSLLADTAR